MATKEDIKHALSYMNTHWQRQNNELDASTNFVYDTDSVDAVLHVCTRKGIDKNYALHRWYNFHCAKYHEYLFLKNGAVAETDPRHKTVDFYINKVPFDLKTSVFPKALHETLDLNKREDKNRLIRWLYDHQSQFGRKHFANRLFVICKDLAGKSDFELIEKRIRAFMRYSEQHGFNQIKINHQALCSDVIWVHSEDGQ